MNTKNTNKTDNKTLDIELHMSPQPNDLIVYKNDTIYFYCPFCKFIHSQETLIYTEQQIITNTSKLNLKLNIDKLSPSKSSTFLLYAKQNNFYEFPTLNSSLRFYYNDDLCHTIIDKGRIYQLNDSTKNGQLIHYNNNEAIVDTHNMIPFKQWNQFKHLFK
jgi:hypothetical protein